MNLIELNSDERFLADPATKEHYQKLRRLLLDLRKRSLPESLIENINTKVEGINNSNLEGKPLQKLLSQTVADLLKQLEKELKLVPQHHYRTLWMVLGMSSFGLPLGVVFGMSIGNIALLGIGLPIGMAIGIAVGTSMDEKAKKEGRQLNLKSEE